MTQICNVLKPFYGKISEKNHCKNLIVGGKQLDFIFLHQFKGTTPLACTMYYMCRYIVPICIKGGVILQMQYSRR